MLYLAGSIKHIPELKTDYFLIIPCLAVQHITRLIQPTQKIARLISGIGFVDRVTTSSGSGVELIG